MSVLSILLRDVDNPDDLIVADMAKLRYVLPR